ncbi:MAG: NUDIX domain-containing protein [Minisyncoccia bacterium]
MADSEQIDIVDENNNVIGATDAATAHEKKLTHRIVGIFVFDVNGGLYVQTGNKYGKHDLTIGGHVGKGESYDDAARREMLEEIGLEVPIKHISTFLPENARMSHFWAIYEATAPAGWKFTETEEVKSLKKMKPLEIIATMNSNPEQFTHGFLNAMREFVCVKGTYGEVRF